MNVGGGLEGGFGQLGTAEGRGGKAVRKEEGAASSQGRKWGSLFPRALDQLFAERVLSAVTLVLFQKSSQG